MATLRSANRSAPRKRYTIDAFEGIEALQSSSSSEGSSREDEDQDTQESDDFEAAAEPEDPEDEAMSGAEDLEPNEEVLGMASDAGDHGLDEDVSIAEDSDIDTTPKKRQKRNKPSVVPLEEQLFVRGMPESLRDRMNDDTRKRYFLGPAKEDWEPPFSARNRWAFEPCLPSRKAASNRGGFHYSDAYVQDVENAESNWRWYREDSGKEAFQQRQSMSKLSFEDTEKYLSADMLCDRTFVMGPVHDRQIYNMKPGEYMRLSDPFCASESDGRTRRKLTKSEDRSGFMINLGARVQCLDWVPNQPSNKQYLAVSLLPQIRPAQTSAEASASSAFAPGPSSDTSIQIWEFEATEDDYVNKQIPPRLCMVLCAAVGHVTELEWCPVPRHEQRGLGLLGIVSADGCLRVLDVDDPPLDQAPTRFLVQKFAIESRPPETVYTSLTWMGSSRIAAACANGFVVVFDIAKALKATANNPRPELFMDISTTYIIALTSCYPYAPHMLITSSMSGYTKLTDTRRPNPAWPTGSVVTTRVRTMQPHILWHEHGHAGLSAEDNLTFRAFPLRRFFSSLGTNRLPSHATSMASSLCHPFVLVGTANGDVVAHNPIRRIIDEGRRIDMFQQTWFSHEWRRPTEAERFAAGAARDSDQSVEALIGRDGLSRITDGFKAQQVTLSKFENMRHGIMFSTVHEEKSAVTTVSWNPNLHVAGWAAAGMADGLLRVEDIAG